MELCKLLHGLVIRLRLSSAVSSLRAFLFGIILALDDPSGFGFCGPTDFGSWSWETARFICTRLHLELRLLESFTGVSIGGVVCVMSSCGMSSLVALAQSCVRREGAHRGSVWCRSATSPQVRFLFLLEVNLTYHCACRLRLSESRIFFSFVFQALHVGTCCRL